MNPKVYVTRQMPNEILEMLRAECEVSLWAHDKPPVPRDVLLREVRDAHGIFSLITEKIDAELMDAAPNLKVISNMAVGYDNIAVSEATQRQIAVGNTPGVLTEATADLAFALLLGAARRVGEAIDYIRNGEWIAWNPFDLLGADVHGKTLGIVGMGRIGAAVARRARGFDMKVLYHNRERHIEYEVGMGAEYAPFDDLLARSDFVSIHTPLTDETRCLFDADAFPKMKRTAILINTSRGGTVDPGALYDALKNGSIAYAALDVTEPEPLPLDHPLLTLPNCLIIPHLGSATVDTRMKMATMAAENLLAGVRGERLPNCVNPEVYA
ncbi:MAG: D-glycerate dehydrogenase, partial [Chloroflexi bacterium]|nr:D-glycerate dehydrogenase [Chloroflexota bacterium]